MSTPQSVLEFARACRNLTHDQIYELFEDEISQELRDEIYDNYSREEDVEPCRAAMIRIGCKYYIASLQDY